MTTFKAMFQNPVTGEWRTSRKTWGTRDEVEKYLDRYAKGAYRRYAVPVR